MNSPSIDNKLEELKATRQEVNLLLAELKAEVKEAKKILIAITEIKNDNWSDVIAETVDQGLEEYKDTLKDSIEKGTQAVYDRFDAISKMLLEGTTRGKRDQTLVDLTRTMLITERAQKMAAYESAVSGVEYTPDDFMIRATNALIKEGRIE